MYTCEYFKISEHKADEREKELQKKLQFLGLQFSDAEHFETANAKFSLHLALAFPNANAKREEAILHHFDFHQRGSCPFIG